MKGEFEFIQDIRAQFHAPDGVLGIGDDCAVIPQEHGMETLVSTDMLIEGSHFLLEDITPYQLGWKSAAVNFSDIAAMGGEPVGSFLALALPRSLPSGWTDEFMRGYRDISERYGFPLLGGDTTASPQSLCVCVTVLGRAEAGRSIKRSTARCGDLLCVTGTLGDSAAGLHALLNGNKTCNASVQRLIQRHYLPQPRISEGRALSACGHVHAMMDISDGMGSDLRHILDESGVGAYVELERIPLSEELKAYCQCQGLDPYDFALDGGEDYELLFTLSPDTPRTVLDALAGKFEYSVVGHITEGEKLVWTGSDKDYKGFRHF